MKKLFLFLLLAFSISVFSEESDPFPNGIEEPAPSSTPLHPFAISGDFFFVKKAHFRDKDIEDETISYGQIDAAFAYTHACNPYCGFIFGAGYVGSKVDWDENPFFSEKYFNYVSFQVGAFTRAEENWMWTLNANMFIDTEILDLADYALYQAVLWGKYKWFDCLRLDVGFILEVGLSKEKIWPILGFEFAPYPEKWSLTVIYPIDISFEYYLSKMWTAGASIRFIRNRHRVRESEPLPRGIFEYQATGAEFDLTFQPFSWFFVTGFVGSTFLGDLKITNANNHDAQFFKFDGSLYAGVSAVLAY